ncbi:MAG: FliG C-terminal domain-containing protein, partial [bacterium]
RKVADRVEPEELALAMKGVVREVSSHILSALGDEQAAAIERAETSLGRVRRQDVDEARRAIIEELRLLEKAGEVVVARPEDVVE